jgi:hypothetical protein
VDKQTVLEMLAGFVRGERAERLPEGDPVRVRAEEAASYFTDGVHTLKTAFPNSAIRDLMAMVWDIVGHRIVPTGMGPNVPCLTLAAVGPKELPQAIIFIPPTWVTMIRENPIYQLGGLVFVGSQAVDFYNGRIVNEPRDAQKRARAHEAEYLTTVLKYVPDTELNTWQRGVVNEYPQGLRNIESLLYKRKAFVPPA